MTGINKFKGIDAVKLVSCHIYFYWSDEMVLWKCDPIKWPGWRITCSTLSSRVLPESIPFNLARNWTSALVYRGCSSPFATCTQRRLVVTVPPQVLKANLDSHLKAFILPLSKKDLFQPKAEFTSLIAPCCTAPQSRFKCESSVTKNA